MCIVTVTDNSKKDILFIIDFNKFYIVPVKKSMKTIIKSISKDLTKYTIINIQKFNFCYYQFVTNFITLNEFLDKNYIKELLTSKGISIANTRKQLHAKKKKA